MTSDVRIQNLMTDVTDAILAGESADPIRARYGIARAESDELIKLIESLNATVTHVEPSAQFKRRLKAELLEHNVGVFWQLQRLPTRVRFAAILTLLGGFMIVIQRLLFGDPETKQEEKTLREKV